MTALAVSITGEVRSDAGHVFEGESSSISTGFVGEKGVFVGASLRCFRGDGLRVLVWVSMDSGVLSETVVLGLEVAVSVLVPMAPVVSVMPISSVIVLM